MRLEFLDSGPLGLLTSPRGRSKSDQCRTWVTDLATAGIRVFVPEIADHEVRRKLIHLGATAGIRRLDHVKATLDYAPLTTDIMLLAAELWAKARSSGLPTARQGARRRLQTRGTSPLRGWLVRHGDRGDRQCCPPITLHRRPVVGIDNRLIVRDEPQCHHRTTRPPWTHAPCPAKINLPFRRALASRNRPWSLSHAFRYDQEG